MKRQLESIPHVSEAFEKAHEWQEDMTENAQKAARATARYIEENPWKAIAIVAVCAMALGFLLKPGSD